jgi:hypothetical protein
MAKRMLHNARFWCSGVLLFLLPTALFGQYWGERVMEKSFEATDFFFSPHTLVPFGLGNFAATTPGLLQDPLLDLVINPAYLGLDTLHTDNFIYTDFRTARNVKTDHQYIYPWARLAATDMLYAPYPQFYAQTRKQMDPVFSGAYIGRLLPETAPNLMLGVTYQLVMQDEKYYSVPQDIYRSVVGADYEGRSMAASSAMPIVDKYSGDDNFHHNGHFLSLFGGYSFPEGFDVGIKLSRVFFTREGAFGSSNLWDSYYSGGASLWSSREGRDQGYNHWDLSAGVIYHLSEKATIGVMGGRLWGNATQSMNNRDSSYYGYNYSTSGSFYNSSGNDYQNWIHAGKTSYLGVEYATRPAANTTLRINYRRLWTSTDISLASNILDTSYSTYTWSDAGTPVNSFSQSYLSDVRTGGGSHTDHSDRGMISLQWQLNERVTLSIGAQVEVLRQETFTSENVVMNSHSLYWNSNATYSSANAQDEAKELQWTFSANRTSLRIPVFVNIKTSDRVGIILGLNREMTSWEINDVTLALFRYRNANNNGVIETKTNFGERYTTPKENVSDITTTFIAGLTVSPSQKFQARVLMVPVFQDGFDGPELSQLQWWLGLTLTP